MAVKMLKEENGTSRDPAPAPGSQLRTPDAEPLLAQEKPPPLPSPRLCPSQLRGSRAQPQQGRLSALGPKPSFPAAPTAATRVPKALQSASPSLRARRADGLGTRPHLVVTTSNSVRGHRGTEGQRPPPIFRPLHHTLFQPLPKVLIWSQWAGKRSQGSCIKRIRGPALHKPEFYPTRGPCLRAGSPSRCWQSPDASTQPGPIYTAPQGLCSPTPSSQPAGSTQPGPVYVARPCLHSPVTSTQPRSVYTAQPRLCSLVPFGQPRRVSTARPCLHSPAASTQPGRVYAARSRLDSPAVSAARPCLHSPAASTQPDRVYAARSRLDSPAGAPQPDPVYTARRVHTAGVRGQLRGSEVGAAADPLSGPPGLTALRGAEAAPAPAGWDPGAASGVFRGHGRSEAGAGPGRHLALPPQPRPPPPPARAGSAHPVPSREPRAGWPGGGCFGVVERGNGEVGVAAKVGKQAGKTGPGAGLGENLPDRNVTSMRRPVDPPHRMTRGPDPGPQGDHAPWGCPGPALPAASGAVRTLRAEPWPVPIPSHIPQSSTTGIQSVAAVYWNRESDTHGQELPSQSKQLCHSPPAPRAPGTQKRGPDPTSAPSPPSGGQQL
ncbi:basic proline-rich protein-like [Choloepus didactylus]|uniref:basic proline-rich protein-like n=1 Tax=Choloepus didactylus TaxID=27675 RepID=UPI00189F4652|nr:basic proline-rich protein-like [Choloepus didactylus]